MVLANGMLLYFFWDTYIIKICEHNNESSCNINKKAGKFPLLKVIMTLPIVLLQMHN